jgi:hypothetical protein
VEGAPDDWPLCLFSGSLSVRVDQNGYPAELAERGFPPTVRFLDRGAFRPAFMIAWNAMQNNKLNPRNTRRHDGGKAQVWRAVLLVEGHRIGCWVFRRIGSGLDQEIEIVSEQGIRQTYGLPEPGPWPATVQLFGGWLRGSDETEGALT